MKSRLSKSSFNIRNNGQLANENGFEQTKLSEFTKNDEAKEQDRFNDSIKSPFKLKPSKQLFFKDQIYPSDHSPSFNSSAFDSPFKSPISKYENTKQLQFRTPDYVKSDQNRVRFNSSTLDLHDDLSSLNFNLKNQLNLSKQNSKSVSSLHSSQVKCLSTPSNKTRQVTKRKNSVNIRQILFDRLTSATSKSNTSIDKSSSSIHNSPHQTSLHLFNNKSHHHLPIINQETPSANIDDFFEFPLNNELPIVNPQLELKLSQIKKAKQASQSIFDLRRNHHQFESQHSNLSFNSIATSANSGSTAAANSTTAVNLIVNSSFLKINENSVVDSAASTASFAAAAVASKKFQRVAKLKTQNANRFKELINSKKFSQSLNDLTMIQTTDDLNWKDIGDAYQDEIRERRYVHHITEIEMDNAVLQTGATLRFVCFF